MDTSAAGLQPGLNELKLTIPLPREASSSTLSFSPELLQLQSQLHRSDLNLPLFNKRQAAQDEFEVDHTDGTKQVVRFKMNDRIDFRSEKGEAKSMMFMGDEMVYAFDGQGSLTSIRFTTGLDQQKIYQVYFKDGQVTFALFDKGNNSNLEISEQDFNPLIAGKIRNFTKLVIEKAINRGRKKRSLSGIALDERTGRKILNPVTLISGLAAIVLTGNLINHLLRHPIALGNTRDPNVALSSDDPGLEGLGGQIKNYQPISGGVATPIPPITPSAEAASVNPLLEPPQESYSLSQAYDLVLKSRELRSTPPVDGASESQKKIYDPDYLRRVDPELNRNRINICMIGLDEDPSVPHNDAILIISVDITTNKASVVSIPRDIHAPEIKLLGDDWKWRINGAYFWGGTQGTRKILEDATGLSQDFCFFYRHDGFRDYINGLGGIDLEITQEFLDLYENEFTIYYSDPKIKPLVVGLNKDVSGELALTYARLRKKDSDFDRGGRQQQVIEATAKKLVSVLKNNPFQLLGFLKTVAADNANEKAFYAGEIEVASLKEFAIDVIDDPSQLDLDNFSFESLDLDWKSMVGPGVLASDFWQLYPVGQSWDDPTDPLQYWEFLRSKIRERLLNQVKDVADTPVYSPYYLEKMPDETILFSKNVDLITDETLVGPFITPQMIIVHWDGNEDPDQSNWLATTTRNGLVTGWGDSATFAVGVDGIIQLVKMTETQVQSTTASTGRNNIAINIEMSGSGFDETPPPEAEIEYAVDLIARLLLTYPNLTIDKVRGHYQEDTTQEDPSDPEITEYHAAVPVENPDGYEWHAPVPGVLFDWGKPDPGEKFLADLKKRVEIRMKELQGKAGLIPVYNNTTASSSSSTDASLYPAQIQDLSLDRQTQQAQLLAMQNSPRARQQARASGNARLNQARRQAGVNIPRGGGRGGRV